MSCRSCYDYDSMKVVFEYSKNYLTEMQRKNKLYCRKIDFLDIKKTATLVYTKLLQKEWSVNNIRSYLYTEGLYGKLVNKIIDLNKRSKDSDFEYNTINNIIKSILLSLWYTDTINIYIELFMYLIFLGVIKTIGFVLKK